MSNARCIAATLAAFAAFASPALAQAPDGTPNSTSNPGTQFQPEGTPNGTTNPGTQHQPEGTPNDTTNPGTGERPGATPNADDNPGAANRPTRRQARAIGREECREFRTNFRENRSAFGRCVAAVARVVRSDVAPGRACRGQSRRREEGQRRSDFAACVVAAARAEREQEQEQGAPAA